MIPIHYYPEVRQEWMIPLPKLNQVCTWYIPYTKEEYPSLFIDFPYIKGDIIDIIDCQDGLVFVVIMPSKKDKD